MRKKIERRQAKQALAQAGESTDALEWQQPKVKQKRGHVFANSLVFRELNKNDRGFVSRARKLIQENLKLLGKGKTIVDKEGRIVVERASTGGFEGSNNFLTLKVATGGKELFVKIASPHLVKRNIQGLLSADDCLRKIGYKFGEFNVRVVMPHKAVDYKGTGYLVTDFFRAGEVRQVSKMENPGKIIGCIENLKRDLLYRGVYDVLPENAFYHQKTNTILLFDLMAR